MMLHNKGWAGLAAAARGKANTAITTEARPEAALGGTRRPGRGFVCPEVGCWLGPRDRRPAGTSWAGRGRPLSERT